MNDTKYMYIGLDVHQATIPAAVLDSARKLVMKCTLEAKGTAILLFIHGPRGSLSVTSKMEPAQFGCCNLEPLASGHYLISTSSIAS